MRFAPCTQRWGEAAPVALLARARGGLTHHFVATRFPHLSQVDDETFDLVHGLFEWDTPEESARSTKLFSLTMLSLMSGKVSTLEDEIGHLQAIDEQLRLQEEHAAARGREHCSCFWQPKALGGC